MKPGSMDSPTTGNAPANLPKGIQKNWDKLPENNHWKRMAAAQPQATPPGAGADVGVAPATDVTPMYSDLVTTETPGTVAPDANNDALVSDPFSLIFLAIA